MGDYRVVWEVPAESLVKGTRENIQEQVMGIKSRSFYAFDPDNFQRRIVGRVQYIPPSAFAETPEEGPVFGGTTSQRDRSGFVRKMRQRGNKVRIRPSKVVLEHFSAERAEGPYDVVPDKLVKKDIGTLKKIVSEKFPEARLIQRERMVDVSGRRYPVYRSNVFSLRENPALRAVRSGGRLSSRALGIAGNISQIGKVVEASRGDRPLIQRMYDYFSDTPGVEELRRRENTRNYLKNRT